MAGKPTTKQAKTKKPAKPKSSEGKGKDLPPELIKALDTIDGKPTPETYRLARNMQMQVAQWENTLFAGIEAQEKGSCIISGLPNNITSVDFWSFSYGVGQILYNQSYQSGNIDTNSGLVKREAPGMSKNSGHTYYEGHIVTTLNDLCRCSYGVTEPSTTQKRDMKTLIETLHKNFITIKFPNGDTFETPLVVIKGRHTRAKDGAVTYWISLNPIFCDDVKRNYLENPQDLMRRLTVSVKRKTEAHLRLLGLLGNQRKDKPFVRTVPVLIGELGMEKQYRKERGTTEERLISVCEDMRKVGIITNYETVPAEWKRRDKKALTKIIFYFNPDYPRKLKDIGRDAQPTES